MKLAVISDLHGNYYALSEVMEFLRRQQIDGIIGLGDFVTDGPFPQRMMGVLREMQAAAELEGGFFDERASGLHVSESYRSGSKIF